MRNKLFARALIAAVVSFTGAWASGCGSDGVVGGGCADGFTDCDGSCLDLEHDPLNCGACAHQCAPGQSCMIGVCGTPASAGGGGTPGMGGASGKGGASGAPAQGGTAGAMSHGGTAGGSGASGHGGAAGAAGGHGGSAGTNAGGASGTSGASGSAGQSAGGIGGSSGEGGVAGSSAGGAMAGGSAGASGGPGGGGVGGDNGGSAGTSGNTGAGGDAGASGAPGAGGMSGASGLGGAGGDTTGGGGMSGASGLGGAGGDTTGAGGNSAGGDATGAGGDTTGGSAGSSGSAGDTGAGGSAGGATGGAAGGGAAGASGSAGNAGAGGGCPPPTIDCSGTCVNPNDDPANCGGCDIVCPTFVCQAKKCVGSLDGHQVLIGMDFSNVPANKVDSRRVLANGSFLNGPRPDGSWNVLGFNPSSSPTVGAVDGILKLSAGAHGITKLNFTHLTLASDVVDQLTKADFDVVVIYDQPTAPAGSLGAAGTQLATPFANFTAQGGNVVILSGGTGTNEMWAFAANAQIMATGAFQQIPIPMPQAGPALVNNNQANSVGIGVSSVFAASPNTGWWTIAADPTIADIIDVSSNGKPVVLHRAVAP